ncbi:HK97 family phage portal protein [Pseudaminobacter salicylatoxidans]|uniref:HK97 family phage portal protein n=1 Tax=Pseudaminobacter salicylatoxidans TaxID=93369 RepID=A0A316C7K2_PSESE|nr:phage portal protein [Pseudaminobacter salicylatoxidans]PWJ73837.1 HK97 family phage portal protein [Pseudaminobacter salicylatoxidans]
MNILGFNIRREARSATSPENESVPVSSENFLAFFGVQSADLPHVTIDRALTVPAVAAAVAFLSRTLAALPLHAYRSTSDGATRVGGTLGAVVHDNANGEMSSFLFRQYFWQQVFTGGRGLAWIERDGKEIVNLWPMDPRKVTVKRVAGRRIYKFENKEYPAADVIDVPFMLKADQLSHYGPINLAAKAIQLAIAMNDYGSNFFAGGGVPPLALSGPLPQGADGLQRAMSDMRRSIDEARKSGKQIVPIPPGHDLKPVGFDPAKGQMTEARLFQIQEIARAWQMPPAFLQDLSKGTFANVEQQDLHLVKHLIGQWAEAFEGEMNLKLFGRESGGLYVEHNLDGLMRGDFKSRVEGIARAIQTAQITPNEGRALENRPKHSNPDADELLVQGATVVLGKQPVQSGLPKPAGDNGENDNAEA